MKKNLTLIILLMTGFGCHVFAGAQEDLIAACMKGDLAAAGIDRLLIWD